MNQRPSVDGIGAPLRSGMTATVRGVAPSLDGALDPERLLEGLATAAEPAPTGSSLTEAAAGRRHPNSSRRMNAELTLAAGRIFANWLVRSTNLPHFRARPDLCLAEVKRGMPELVIAAIAALAAHDPILQPEPDDAAAAAAIALARARAAHGFTLSDVLTEIQELRAELLTAVWRIVDTVPTLDSTPRDLAGRFLALDGILFIAISDDWVTRLSATGQVPVTAAATAATGADS